MDLQEFVTTGHPGVDPELSIQDIEKMVENMKEYPESKALLFIPEGDGYRAYMIPKDIARKGVGMMASVIRYQQTEKKGMDLHRGKDE